MQQKGTLGFAQESYDDKGMWMESQAQQQQSHGFHEDSWNTSNNNNYHHKQQFPGAGMQLMKPSGASAGAGPYYTTDSHSDFSKHHGAAGAAKLGGNYGMFHENMSSGGQGYGHGNGNHGYGQMNHGNGKKYPYGGGITTHTPHNQFSNGGGRFNHGGGHNNHMNDDYVSEEYEYEAHREEHGGIAKMEEKRYEHHNYGGDLRYANPYGGGGHGYNKNNMGMNMNMMRPHGYGGNNHKVEWSVKGV